MRGKSVPRFARAKVTPRSQEGARIISKSTDPRSNQASKDERSAVARSRIPARDWKRTIISVWRGILQHRVLAIAAGVTFYALLAVFPAIAALVAIYSLFADPSTIRSMLKACPPFCQAARPR